MKFINRWYNKSTAYLQKKLDATGATKQMERLTNKRNRRVDHILYTVSKQIIALLIQEGIGTLIIGKNDDWKQEANRGMLITQIEYR